MLVHWVSVDERSYDSFQFLWVANWLNGFLVVSDQIVVKFESPWLLLFKNNFSYLQEELINLAVVVVELLRSLKAARGLVGLENDQELGDELTALSEEQVFIQVN